MIATVYPGKLSGTLAAIPSKSHVHRQLICAALADKPTQIYCPALNADIEATASCLNAMCADITYSDGTFTVIPAKKPSGAIADCGESGSTYRFLLPVAAALGTETTFRLHGRLPQRPMSELTGAMESHGVTFSGLGTSEVTVHGKLSGGTFSLPGDVSSQYISGLLMALPKVEGESTLRVTGRVESAAYITMTEEALRLSGIAARREENCWHIPGAQRWALPRECRVEGDYSNAAFFLCMGALSKEGVTVTGLSPDSRQGDRGVLEILRRFGAEVRQEESWVQVRRGTLRGLEIDAADIPDLVPILAVTAAFARGETRIRNIRRLRLKESDRVMSVVALIRSLGGRAEAEENEMIIEGTEGLRGGRADAFRDHRIAMAAAVAATGAEEPVILDGAEAVNKSYPGFFEQFRALGGRTEP